MTFRCMPLSGGPGMFGFGGQVVCFGVGLQSVALVTALVLVLTEVSNSLRFS